MKKISFFRRDHAPWHYVLCLLCAIQSNRAFATKALRLEENSPSDIVLNSVIKRDVYIHTGRSAILSPAILGIKAPRLEEPSDPSSFLLRMTSEGQQQQTITGTVRDAQGSMPGVTVGIEGSNVVVLTDENGRYVINAAVDDVLVFSYVGYGQFTVAVAAGSTTIDVLMREDATTLQEVTVNAGYYTVKDSERTGSIAKITAKDIETQPVTNVLAAMQGRMAGVNITQNTGVPGGNFDIQIRGQNSIRDDGNSPLYIIDGVPYASEPIGNGFSMSIVTTLTSPLNNINPADIESIEVLKDADATAIYGSRGANGVVLITTRKGKKGQTRYAASFSQGTGTVSHFMDLMNTRQYLAMRAEGFANDGITEYPDTAYDINGTWNPDRYTNWQEKFIGGTAKISNVRASVSGGSGQTQFLMSTNFGSESTVFPGDFGYKKSGVHLNVSHGSEDNRFRISFSGNYNIQDNEQPAVDLTVTSWTLAPNAPALYDAEGNLNWENNTFENPLARLNATSQSKTHDLVANSVLSYELAPGLEIKTNLGYTALNHHENTATPSTVVNPALGAGGELANIFFADTSRESWIVEPQLNWKPTFGPVRTDFLLGGTLQSQRNKMTGMGASGFPTDAMIQNPAAAAHSEVMNFDESLYRYQSVFARANFNLKERYILNITGRRDGSSRFGPGRQYAWFGAVGTAWLFSREPLLANSTVWSFGKLRASYGTTGNDQIGNYKYLNTYTAGSTIYDGMIGLQPTRLYNAAFGWETNKKLEFALETGFFKDRLFFTAAWYRNRSSDQLVGVPMPGTTGFTQLQSNLAANVENSGIELTLAAVNFQRKDFSWRTDINFSTAKNTLLSFPDLASSTYRNRYVIGHALNIEKVYRYTGIDPDTGIYTFEDVNGDGLLTDAEDKTTIRDLNPSYFGGVHNQLRYKGWELNFLFQFVKQQNYDTATSFGIPGTMNNQTTHVLPHWQQPGDTGPYQVYTSGENGAAVQALYRYFASDAAFTDASYIRLKNISLGYDFPERWLPHVRCRATLEAQNLLTFTSFDGPDPEFKAIGTLPPLRIITAGLTFNF